MENCTVIIERVINKNDTSKLEQLLQDYYGNLVLEVAESISSLQDGNCVFAYFESRELACDFTEKVWETGADAQIID